ncbi:MAG TPA: type VI secretion system ATPase TssH [Gemmataceae bacterium]|nr:type VI secretion system ATPase TssH [Gemmataceae bacterium]
MTNRLNETCRRGLEGAAGLCLSRTNYNVEIEHWLLKLLEPTDTDLARILRHYDVDAGRVSRELTRALDQLRTGNARSPELSLELLDLMREGWVVASLEYNAARVRSGHLLAALLSDRALATRTRAASAELARIPAGQLSKDLAALIAGSVEDAPAPGETPAATTPGRAADSKTPSLDQFTMNLTDLARRGGIDPVVGRDGEIRQVIDILMRRRQNNPILTGEAGVGKTAVVEGFALRVAAGDVPPPLKGVIVRTLDLGLLQAGAGVKGEFENRLKSVIAEVKASPQPVILFIDEAHTLIGAGAAAGQGDAANLLKPALARGELRTIAATTWAEYKKSFETDAALKRRFQVVKVAEPDEAVAIGMMMGLTATLEKHHHVRILDEAIEDAVKLSHRYLTDRQLPDKAVSVLDTACARVALGLNATPPAVEDCQREIEALQVQMAILEREMATGVDHSQRLQELTDKKRSAETRLEELRKRWAEEKRLVEKIQELSVRLSEKPADGAARSPADIKADRDDLMRLESELARVQGESPLLRPFVDSQSVSAVISAWTGIPLGKMVLDEIKTVLTLQDRLKERVVGQDHALEAIAERIRTARANLVDPRRPIGVFLLVGPSGVGKTETAMALADILYGGDRSMVVINMSEYKEDHKISRLTGSAPGYVGYGEGGVLTEAVRRKPYSIVLLDEVEKANVAVQEIFYQVFDKGMLQDDKGGEINFKNTIILLTSNVGSDTIMKVCADPDTRPDAEGLAVALRPDLLKAFKPALLGRLNVVPYFPLADEVLRQIIRLQLNRIRDRVRENYRVALDYDEAVIATIASRCQEVESGARNVDHIVTGTLLPELSREFLTRMAEGRPIQSVHIGVEGEGRFLYKMDGENAVGQ